MKGIIMAGGSGTRLYPLTEICCKQLLPVYDKPMVYYPLSTLLENGVREICLISTRRFLPLFRELFGDGSRLGVSIEYCEQERPAGIAQCFSLAEGFINGGDVSVILGDNIFFGTSAIGEAFKRFNGGATVFGYRVKNPRRYGVVEFDRTGQAISIEEKPKVPKSNFAVTGLYLYDSRAVSLAKGLSPSERGELEITDVNRAYLERGELKAYRLERGTAWLDAGTSSSLHEACAYVETIESRQGIKVGCPEEAAYRGGALSLDALAGLVAKLHPCEYKEYLELVVEEARNEERLP